MDLAVLIPIVGIIGGTWMFLAALRYVRERQAANDRLRGDGRDKVELARENAELRSSVARMEQRLAVLERIATDPAERTAREIESLR